MNHLNEELFDIYVLNKTALGKQLSEVELHLEQCNECRNHLEEIQQFYLALTKEENYNIKYEDVKEIVEKRKKENIPNLDSIFKDEKKNPFDSFIEYFANSFGKISSLIDSITGPLKLAFSVCILIMASLLIYKIFYKPDTMIISENKEKYIRQDTSKSQNQLEVQTKKDTSITRKYEIQDTAKKNISETKERTKDKVKIKQIKKPLLGLFAIIPTATAKGSEQNYEFIGSVNSKGGNATLLAYNTGLNNLKSEDEIENFVEDNAPSYQVQFPKTEISELNGNKNLICDIKLIGGKYIVEILENGNAEFCKKGELIKYYFTREMKVDDLEFSQKFETKYSVLNETQIGNKSLEELLEELKDDLLKNVRYWNGKKYVEYDELIK